MHVSPKRHGRHSKTFPEPCYEHTQNKSVKKPVHQRENQPGGIRCSSLYGVRVVGELIILLLTIGSTAQIIQIFYDENVPIIQSI